MKKKKKKKNFFFYSRVHPGAAVGCVSAIRVHPGAALQGLNRIWTIHKNDPEPNKKSEICQLAEVWHVWVTDMSNPISHDRGHSCLMLIIVCMAWIFYVKAHRDYFLLLDQPSLLVQFLPVRRIFTPLLVQFVCRRDIKIPLSLFKMG